MFFNYSLRAPEFPKNFTWLNTTEALSLQKVKGHVVILDFWTYCCINCIHTLPDLKFLEEKYKDKPFLVLGIHSAKFMNEQDQDNIASAIARYQIDHPVLVDEHHQVWDSYAVRAWPTLVVIDTEGKIRAHYSGEGHREELDKVVYQLLLEGRQKATIAPQKLEIERPKIAQTNTLSFPGKIFVDAERREVFISDSNHHQILHTRIVSPTELELISLIGSGKPGREDGNFTTASFKQPQGICRVDDHLFVCDTENHLLRKVELNNREVVTVAGTGEQAHWGSWGGTASITALSSPWDIAAADQHGKTTFYIAMAGSHQIWQYSESTKKIDVFAGSGSENIVDGGLLEAQLAQPSGICYQNDALFVADSEVSAVRKIDLNHNDVETLVGSGLFQFGWKDGEFEDALLQHPLGVTAEDNLVYVADTYNHAIRLLDTRNQTVKTLIKRESHSVCSIDDKNCTVLPLNEPNDVKLFEHFLYIADTNNHLIRVFDLDKKTLQEVTIKGL